MHALHVTPHVSRLGGGVWSVVLDLAGRRGDTVVGMEDGFDDAGEIEAVRLRRRGPRMFAYMPALRRTVADRVGDGVVHLHGGLRMLANVSALRGARDAGAPVILSPHGSLYPQMLAKHRGRKAIASVLYDRKLLESVDAFHATCTAELETIRAAGLKQPVAVVAPGVDVPASVEPMTGERTLLYLGLFDRKKGLLRLAETWRKLRGQFPDWRLVLAGPDQDGHMAEVRVALGDAPAEMPGAVYGDAKAALFNAADVFVLPSDWENFGVVVGEALAHARPVIAPANSPWDWLGKENAGWQVDATNLEPVLREALGAGRETLSAMSERGRTVVEREYAWPVALDRFAETYAWLRGGPRPSFVDHV
ncbi:MAG: glycosyltransferase [Planctomycetota bacterium]